MNSKEISRMIALLRITLITFSISSCSANANDEYLWLEDNDSAETQKWIKKENQATLNKLGGEGLNVTTTNILSQTQSKKAIDWINFIGKRVTRLKRYSESSKGVLESITLEDSTKENPKWRKLIDFDELSKLEGKDLSYSKSSACFPENPDLCLLGISMNGSDSREFREFDMSTGKFVDKGFRIPLGETSVAWVDKDTLIFSSTFKGNKVSEAEYGLSVKKWSRGTNIAEATTILEKESGDGLIPQQYVSGKQSYILIQHWLDFYSGDIYEFKNDKLKKLKIPVSHELYGVNNGFAIVKNYETWNINSKEIPKGSLIGVDLSTTGKKEKLEPIFSPARNQAFEEVSMTKSHVLIRLLEDMITKPLSLRRVEKNSESSWESKFLTPPSNEVLRIRSTSNFVDEAIVAYRGFLNPNAIYFMNPFTDKHRFWKKAELAFDNSGMVFEYKFATSADGVKIPYQIARPKTLIKNKKYPTIIYVYGAYGSPMTAWHRSDLGTEWLAKNRVYVIANARGGGAYGEEWHQAAMRTTKYKTTDDVAAVAKELINSGITSSKNMGVTGASAGGGTSCAALIRYPDLFNAAVCQSAILDLMRYTILYGGKSWSSELGDPNKPEEREYLSNYSPYNMVQKLSTIPPPFFLTFSNDDRVHPGHSRRMVRKMKEKGLEAFIYESPEGGHNGATTNKERALVRALKYEYFSQRLATEK